MTNHDESTQRPGRGAIVLHAAIFGLAVGILVWLVATYPAEPRWYDRLGVLVWVGLAGLDLFALVKTVQRRRATPPSGYLDRDGERWEVRPDGTLGLPGSTASGFTRETVSNEWGPLTPIRD